MHIFQPFAPRGRQYITLFSLTVTKTIVYWDVAPCSFVKVYGRFSGVYCLHHQDVSKLVCRKSPEHRQKPDEDTIVFIYLNSCGLLLHNFHRQLASSGLIYITQDVY